MVSQRVLLVLSITLHVAVTKEVTYKAGVVEYGGQMDPSSFTESLLENVKQYRQMLKSAASEGVDIIVFPEATLNHPGGSDRKIISGFAFELPDPKDKVALCEQTRFGNELSDLSCAVKDSKLYAVLHLNEKFPCKNGSTTAHCPDEGFFLYSSNIVFDREGRIISRYRKTNLFDEPYIDKTPETEVETFTTDFGVTFGHMICFDSMFINPLHALLKKGVKNFVSPVMWFSELPFLTGIQFHSALSQVHNVNFLLSGARLPLEGCTGSGIFAGQNGIKTAFVAGTSNAKLITADLHADPSIRSEETFNTESIDSANIILFKDFLQFYDWNFVDVSKSATGYTDTVCSDLFCCSFYIKTNQNRNVPKSNYYHFAMVVFDGVRNFSGSATSGVQNCGVIACTTDEFSSCGTRFSTTGEIAPITTFETIKINGTFHSTNATQFPVSLAQNLLPFRMADSNFIKTTTDNVNRIEYELTKPHDDLLSFGIFGRHYSTDGQPVSKKSSIMDSAKKARNLQVFESADLNTSLNKNE